MKRLTTEDFIEKSKEKHNDKYDYSLVKYKNAHSKVKIICHNHDYLGNEHGVFEIAPYSHLSGHGCPKCGGSNILSIDEWIYKAKQIHGNKYDYSKITDTRSSVKGIIICPLHGEFRQNLNSHLQGAGCPMCKNKQTQRKINNIIKKEAYHNNKSSIINAFIDDFKQNVSKHFTISNNGGLNIKNYAIHFHELKHNERDDLNKISRENRKLNINTIHIFEDEYYERGNIIFKKLKHILNLDNNNKQKIMARKCIIKEIDSTSAFDFLNKNHIQGSVPATIYLGAFYNDNIIGVMTFLHEGKNKWNLNRFASDNNYICSGIGGKLFKYFIKNYEYDEIKSFADKRWTINEDDNVYIKLGFKKDMILSPEYRYINGEEKIRYHKFGFRKQILIKKYPNAGLNINMTEREMTEKLGYQRIWDCGLIKYVYKNNK